VTTTFFLVRHARHELVDSVLVGRADGVALAASGQEQAQQLAAHFAALGIGAVQSSPRTRAMQTAQPIAERARVDCRPVDALDEIDLGAWTGCAFRDLEDDPAWREWNSDRARARAPGGEAMQEVQSRLVRHLRDCCADHPGVRVVLVSHADVIKAALLHYLGTGLDGHDRIEIAPASVSTLAVGAWGGKVISMNERVAA
jgi:probable phosphoglycerate mutase